MRRIKRNAITRNNFGPRGKYPEMFYVKTEALTLFETKDKELAFKELEKYEKEGILVKVYQLKAGSLEVIS